MESTRDTKNGDTTHAPGARLKATHKAAIGAAAWAGFVVWRVDGLRGDAWALALLLFSALVLAPLARTLLDEEGEDGWAGRLAEWTRALELPAALLLAVACAMAQGPVAMLAALPWAAVGVLGAATAVLRLKRDGIGRDMDKACGDAALVFLAVGGAWALVDRAGWRPLGFSPAIVALTAVHFHYAGWLLPIGAGVVAKEFFFSRLASRAVVGVILGVPAVALGIVATQSGSGPAIESAAGWGLGLAGMIVAIFHVRIGLEAKIPTTARALFVTAGASLFFGMALAEVYAMRAYAAPLPWLDLPWMRALHGTLNALGFGLAGVLAWRARRATS